MNPGLNHPVGDYIFEMVAWVDGYQEISTSRTFIASVT